MPRETFSVERRMQRRAFLALAALAVSGAQARFRLLGQRRVVFLGDSITAAGMYVDYVDAFLRTRFPQEGVEILNLGLPSEGVTGLSEPDHPYPRPDLHERLTRVLDRTAPDMVVACYGMNDGIYYPFTEQRFQRYQAGIRKLVENVKAHGARLVLLTPPPFDPIPVRGKTLPEDAFKFSWMQPFAGYDGVLERYAQWLLTLRREGQEVVDVHGPVSAFIQETRKAEPGYFLAGDGVHINANGHAIMAAALLQAWGARAEVDRLEVDVTRKEVTHGTGTIDRASDRSVTVAWKSPVPFPYDPQWSPGTAERLRLTERFNDYRLRVVGLDDGRYNLLLQGGAMVGQVSRRELGAGVNLLTFPDLPPNRQAADLLKIIQKRQRLLGSTWLTAAGHKRPDTPAGLPLDEAQRQAAELDQQARRLAEPVSFRLTVERA